MKRVNGKLASRDKTKKFHDKSLFKSKVGGKLILIFV